MRNFEILTAVAASFCLAGLAHADAPNYKFIDLLGSNGELDFSVTGLGAADIDQDGGGLEVSYSFLDDRLWVFGSYSDVSGDEAAVTLGVETTRIGTGWIFKPVEKATVDVSLLYREDKLSFLSSSGTTDGFGLAVGARGTVFNRFEVFGRVGYLDGDYEGALTIDLGVLYNIGERWAFSVSFERLDIDDQGVGIELNQTKIGVRVKF